MKSKLTAILLALAVGAFGAQCDDGGDNNDETLLLGLAALASQSGSNSAFTAEQQAAVNAANGAAAVGGSVASAANQGGNTAMILERERAVAGLFNKIVKNGRDPYLVRNEVRRIHAMYDSAEAPENTAQLAALTFASNGTVNGKNSYTFSGTVDGVGTTTIDYPIGQYSPYIEDSCTVSLTTIDYSSAVGTATISNGVLTFDGTGTGTGFSGTAKQTYDASFNNFGAAYIDYYSYLKALSNGSFGSGFTDFNCATITATYQQFSSYIRSPIIASGDMSAEYSSNYSSSSQAFSSSYTSKATSPNGLVIDGALTTFDITVAQTSSSTFANGAASGTFTISFNGTVNGTPLSQELTVSYP